MPRAPSAGADHMDLFDGKPQIGEAVILLAPFFQRTLVST